MGKLIRISSRSASVASISPLAADFHGNGGRVSSRIVCTKGCSVRTQVNSKGADKVPVSSSSEPKRWTQRSYSSGPTGCASSSGRSKISFGSSPETGCPSSGRFPNSIVNRPFMGRI
jgi:hypothetical protein